jgi:hypothetical protein
MADNQVDQENTQPLILPPPAPSISLPEPDDDTHSESSIEEQEEHSAPHMIPPSHSTTHSDMVRLLQHCGIQTLFFLHTVWTWISYAADKAQVVTKGVVRSLQSKTYVFFKDNTYPYRLQEFVTTGPGVAPVEWYYDADQKLFVASHLYTTNTGAISRHFQWLSGEIKYNGLVLYDVSDFLEDAKWAGVTQPTPSRILAAWSLHSGIVLEFREGLTLHTINEDGTESVLQLRV